MRSAWFKRLGLAALAGLALAGSSATTAGCASERDDINRVQPNAIRKNDLVGDFRDPKAAPEFYARSLILAVQRTNPWVSDGLQDLTRRVRFEITEDFLIARNAYEYIQNSDGHGGVKGQANKGNPVAMWPITSHFNIQRSYNQATGEKTNVIEENSSDVPWYEREYMRVDWSRNLVQDPNQIFFWESFSGDLKWKPIAYFENRPGHAEASNFAELGQGYFDVTSKWLAGPETWDYYGYKVPSCLFKNGNLYPDTYSEGSIECSDQEVTLRTSFWKVPTGEQSSDYEVAEVTPWEGNIMGNLTMDRSGYDRNYGVVDATWHTYIMRYNLWKKSHTSTACGQDNKKADANALCAGSVSPDSTCDMNAKLCTIPYEQREVKPLTFYLDPELPEALHPATSRAMGEWNGALSRAIAYARETECRHAGGDRATCHEKYFDGPIDPKKEDVAKLKEGEVVVACHNPVAKGDHPACGQEGFKVRKGDIRYHMVAWWNNPSFNRPLGVVVWSGDPTTGENIGSLVNIFGASVETYSASARDQLQLINGDFTPAEYAAGLPRKVYATENLSFPTDPINDPILNAYQKKLTQGVKPAMTPEEISARLKAVDVAKIQKEYGFDKYASLSVPEKISAWYQHVAKQSTLGDPSSKFADPTAYTAKLNKRMEGLKAGGFEPKVMNDLWLSSVGMNPASANDPGVLDTMSPLRAMNPTTMAIRNAFDEERMRKMHMCSLEMPEMLRFTWQGGYAAKLKARYPDGATATGEMAKRAGVEGQTIDRFVRGRLIYQELLEPMYEFTLLHETGHLMSMEHDFSGSWDSPNFYPEYWAYRAQGDKGKMVACTAARNPGDPDNCMGPRWLDPATDAELGLERGKEHDSLDAYAVSSVMDYKFDSLYAAKLGLMDKMAAKFIYTRQVELFDEDQYSLIKNSRAVGKQFLPTLTILNGEFWVPGGQYNHYTDLGRKLNLFDPARCRPQTDEEKAKGIGAMGLVCAAPHKDHAFLKDMKDDLPAGGFGEDWRVQFAREKSTAEGGFADPATAKYRWPYKVGDGRTSYVHQYVYDNGADMYEITADILERYELMYLDYFFRKGGRERNINMAGYRMFSRFFERIQSLQWNALSDVVRSGTGVTEEGGNPDAQANILALTMLFDSMQAAFLRPQPGAYVAAKQPGSLFDAYSASEDESVAGAFKIGVGDGRYIDHKYDLTKQFDYQAYALRAGSFLEKPFAGIALTDSRPQLSTVARETYLDGRNVMFSFRSAVPQAFDRLVAGVFADDWDTIAPYVPAGATPDSFGMMPMKYVRLWDDSKLTEKVADPRPAGSKLIDPMLGYRIKVPAMIMMLLYQPIDSSMDLVNRTRVWIDGSPEAIKVADAERITFFDPVDGLEWTAKSFGTETLKGKIVDTGIGARMLEHANELMMAAYNVETNIVNATTGQKTVKYGPDRRPQRVGGGALTAADVKDAVAEKKLRDYVAFLNQVRTAMYYLGFGPCGYSYDRDC